MIKTKKDMIETEEDTIVDLRISCTIEEAIAKMLGWLQGPHFKKIIKTTEYGIPPDELPYLLKLGNTLERQLEINRKIATNNLSAAIEDYENYVYNQKDQIPNDKIEDRKNQAIQEKIEVLRKATKTTRMARLYKMAIFKELAKGESSALKIDQEATEENCVKHITIESLHNWAKNKFGISVCPEIDQYSEVKNSEEQSDVQPEDDALEGKEKKDSDLLSPTKKENIYTTFAFLVDAFCKIATQYKLKDSSRPNVSQLAGHIATLAKEANKGEPMKSQSSESIKERIEEAMKIKKLKLPIKS